MSSDEITKMFESDAAEEAQLVPEDNELGLIATLCDEQLEVEDEITDIKKELKIAEKKLFDLQTEKIPKAMGDAGCESFTLTSGQTVSVKKGYQAHIKKVDVLKAHAWLRDNGHGGLIKNEFKIGLGLGEEDQVKLIEEFLDEHGQGFSRKEAVHAGTLKSFVGEQMAREKCDLPQDLFGVFEYTISQIKDPPKTRKSRK